MSPPDELRTARPAGPRTLGGAASTWLERHAQTLVGSLGRLARQPIATILTIAVIGIALALPAALYLVVANARAVTAGLADTVQLSVYLRLPITAELARKVARAIEARDEVGQAELISPDEGLVEFRKLSGIGEALNALTDNPLPWLVRVHPAAQNDSAAAVEMLAAELRQLPEVELVEADTAWVRRLDAILDALRQVVVLAAAVLALGVLAIVGNTIRLDINSRRAEIEVTKLVGGSNAFVRRPFLYSGFWQGLAGGLLAVALIATGLAILEAPIARVAAAYGASFTLQGLATREWLAVIGGGATLGLLGAWLAAAYHLHRIEPRA
ncbi:MAG TPA: permease-like cell division protein FtsX [Steroidobacteraceae bacterium]|nr:permease-like cell division protein FtsX [Steroidobacteraceae bacterium]